MTKKAPDRFYYTIDNGETWNMDSTIGEKEIHTVAVNSPAVLAGTRSYFYRSIDNGSSW